MNMDFRADILPHRDRLYRLALGITLHAAEAEDIVQDTMLRAWERRSEWPQIQNVEAWLMQICRNLALDRKKHAQYEVKGETFGHTTVQDPSVDSKQPAMHPDDMDARESLRLILRLIGLLPPPQDEIIRLRDIEGFSYREIAIQLELTEDQVRVYLHRARQKLRQQYLSIQSYGL